LDINALYGRVLGEGLGQGGMELMHEIPKRLMIMRQDRKNFDICIHLTHGKRVHQPCKLLSVQTRLEFGKDSSDTIRCKTTEMRLVSTISNTNLILE